MRKLFNDARKCKVIATDPTEFLQFKEQAVRKVKLTAGQIVQLEACELSGRQADARNTFML